MPGPHDKREPRGFEPPPWERDQFDELKRQQPGEVPQPPEPTAPVAPPETPAEPEMRDTPEEAATPVVPEDPPEASVPQADPAAEAGIPEARMDAMIMSLGAEEGPTGRDLYGCGLVAAVVTGFIGVVMLVFAGIAYARTAEAGLLAVIGPMAMGLTGGALTGLAVWLAVRTLRRGA